MIAAELISKDIPFLTQADKGKKALQWMEEYKISELPVTKADKYLGLVDESDLLDTEDPTKKLKDIGLTYRIPFIYKNEHIFEAMRQFVENELDILPVVDKYQNYLGVITVKNALYYFAKSTALNNPGSVLTLEMNLNDYSISEIGRIVESDNAKILSLYLSPLQDVKKLLVTIKLNKSEISRILQTFERFNYTVVSTYNDHKYHEDLKNKYDAFMKFIDP